MRTSLITFHLHDSANDISKILKTAVKFFVIVSYPSCVNVESFKKLSRKKTLCLKLKFMRERYFLSTVSAINAN